MNALAEIGPRLREALPAQAFREMAPRYLEEPRGRWAGRGGLLVAPGSAEEVAAIVRACAGAGVPVVPYGGGTGLVGGQVSGDVEPVIVSLERMDRMRSVDPIDGVIVAEAGVILQRVQEAAEAVGRLFPLAIAAQGSARIGGILATNAGGVNVLRYGNARDLCLGIEAVLPDGAILHGLSPLRKDNLGYDLRHLLIGAEGTLGIITAASLKLVPRPAATGAAMVEVASPAAALDLLNLARDRLGEAVSAFELIGRTGLDFLAETMPEVRLPLGRPGWSALIDVGMTGDAEAALAGLLETAFEAGLVADGVVAQSEAQRADFWRLRESIPEANRRIGAVSSHDIAVPLGALPRFIEAAPAAIAPLGAFRVNCFGHVGDGNLHWNVFPMPGATRADHADRRDAIKRAVHDLVHSLGGSVAAEHGVGRLKVDDVERYADPAKLAAMRAIKAALDPRGIMNPGAVIRAA